MKTTICMPPEPACFKDNYGAHAFNPSCNFVGGSSFRHWCSLYYHKGVFIGYDNHKWVVCVSSDPEAKWFRGCQNSAAHGDPYPHSKTARILRWNECPEEVKESVLPIIKDAVVLCCGLIAKREAKEAEEREIAELEAKLRQKEIVNNWVKE